MNEKQISCQLSIWVQVCENLLVYYNATIKAGQHSRNFRPFSHLNYLWYGWSWEEYRGSQLVLINFERSFLCTTVKLRKVMRTWGLFSEFYKIGPQTRLSALFQKKIFFQFCHYFDISEKKWPILPLMMSLSGKFECDFKKTLASFMIYHLSPRLYEWTLLGVIYFRIPSEIQWGETLFVEEQSY